MTERPVEVVRRFDAKARMLATIAAYMGGTLSEGQACRIINCQPIDLREIVQEYNVVAQWLWKRYRLTKMTIDDDMASEVPKRSCRCND